MHECIGSAGSAKFDGMLEIRLGIPPTCGLQQQRAKGGKVRGFTTSCWSPLLAPSSLLLAPSSLLRTPALCKPLDFVILGPRYLVCIHP